MAVLYLVMHSYKYGVYGFFLKLVFVILCAGIIIFILKKESSFVRCKNCNSRIRKTDIICKKCGVDLTNENKEIIIKKTSKKAIALCVSIPVILLALIISSVIFFSNSNNFLFELSGSLGVYLERHENYSKRNAEWEVECQALSGGKLKKVINSEHKKLSEIRINNYAKNNDMILHIEQNNLKESIDINDNGIEQIINMENYSTEEIRLTVEHNKADNIAFQVKWD